MIDYYGNLAEDETVISAAAQRQRAVARVDGVGNADCDIPRQWAEFI